MKHLPEGTEKYLLLHRGVISRNSERTKTGEPVAVVIEIVDGKPVKYHGYNVLTQGPVSVGYSQRDPLLKVRFAPHEEDEKINAAYYTTSAVLIAETPDEPLMFTEPSTTEEPKADTSTADTKKPKKS